MFYTCNASDLNATLEAFADVSGPGVIASFLGPAFISVGLVFFHYILAFDPEENPFRTELPTGSQGPQLPHGPGQYEWTVNPIDKLAKQGIRWLFKRFCGFNGQILWLGSSEFTLRNDLSAYHFQLIVRVAWFSNLTHLAGLTVLRNYLHSRPVEKRIRLSLMVVLSIMLLFALVPTLSFNWSQGSESSDEIITPPGSKAICYFNIREIDASASTFSSGLVSMLLVLFSLVYWLLVSTVWGTFRFVKDKSSVSVKENDWTFGQILPMFLLLGPVAALISTILEARQHQSDNDRNIEAFCSRIDAANVEPSTHAQSHGTPDDEHDNLFTLELMVETAVNHREEVDQLLQRVLRTDSYMSANHRYDISNI
ncbi:hypothetical protein EDB81DRAFT_859648 [Dactylonectria macrodidyma]|uniref:Uncharacterized protein n=1 Tax=Dactylonectria macrodidyma TaxID=307937 RepID=A0A9P9E3Y5_9HYPO|nr:hypothetical protein EDB81DRAFT_859648 [Dactylonectria macrodidyma]